MITAVQWTPPSQLDRKDIAAIDQLRSGLANGTSVYPEGSVGQGLYPNQWMPLLDRAAKAIIEARATGNNGEIVGIVYFPRATDVDSFAAQLSNKPVEQYRSRSASNYPDSISVFLAK